MTKLLSLVFMFVLLGSLHVQAAQSASQASSPPVTAVDEEAVLTELTRITTILQEAIRTGDSETFGKHSTEGLTLVGRDGQVYDRKSFLDELVPPREGYDLHFKVLEPRMVLNGDTALYTYITDEYLKIFGHDVSTKYINHLLYHRIDGAWKLALFTFWEKPSTPPRVSREQRELARLAGTYELEPGKWIHRVFMDGDRLMVQRGTAEPTELVPMAGDRFYIPGYESEFFFERDKKGRPTALVLRRNWVDLRMGRTS